MDSQPAMARPGPAQATLAERINALLPQTQCTRCGFDDCRAYAHAVANGLAEINQCPPGGSEGVARLAKATGRPALPLNPAHGAEGPRSVAVIDEAWCIGCTLCLAACPTDAILGTNKAMHTVIASDCTGCELCLPVCPVDCIVLENASGNLTGWNAWSAADADKARRRYERHLDRTAGQNANAGAAPQRGGPGLATPAIPPSTVSAAPSEARKPSSTDNRKAVIEAALARARAKRPPP